MICWTFGKVGFGARVRVLVLGLELELGLELGLLGRVEMEDAEIEEGEACCYKEGPDINPDIDLSYIVRV